MKVGVFNNLTEANTRFQPFLSDYKEELEVIYFNCPPLMENLYKISEAGCEALLYFNDSKETDEFFEELARQGIKYLSTTSTGYDHYNLEIMRKNNMKGSNVPRYSPNAIAEHTVLMLLALLRNFRKQIYNIDHANYSLNGLMGKELRNMKVGIIGAGRIGYTTMKCLSGFGPKKIYTTCHAHRNPEVMKLAEYVELEELYEKSDVIIFHCALAEDNYHMVNKDTIKKMKDGVILVNSARGGLFDTEAVLEAVKCGKIGALGLDVIEGEGVLDGKKHFDSCPLPILKELLQYENVIFTTHTAFYTDEAFRNITQIALENLYEYATTGKCQNEVVDTES